MPFRRVSGGFVFVCLLASAAAAQEPLTLDRAVREALAHNPSLRAAHAGAAEAGARVAEARAGWFPRLSVSEAWRRSDQPVFVFSSLLSARRFTAADFAIDALNHPDAINFFQTTVGLEQLVFDGGLQHSMVRAAALRRDISDRTSDETAAGVVLSVTETFGRAVTADSGHRAAMGALDAAREDHARALRRRDAGVATDADVLALAANIAELEQRVIQLEGDAAIARAELNRLMGAPIERDYTVSVPADMPEAADANASLDALFAEADRSRPELLRAKANAELAETSRGAARASLMPQVAAQGAVDVSGTRFSDRTSAWAIGGAVRWNLSLGGAERARLRAAAEERTRASAEADDLRSRVQVEIVGAVRRLQTALARQRAGRAAVDEAAEAQRIIRNRYEAGAANVTDVLRASSAVLDADARRTQAAVDALVSEAMLRRAVGRQPQ
jgi:outer membrane protein